MEKAKPSYWFGDLFTYIADMVFQDEIIVDRDPKEFSYTGLL